jgi:hypothetical protein
MKIDELSFIESNIIVAIRVIELFDKLISEIKFTPQLLNSKSLFFESKNDSGQLLSDITLGVFELMIDAFATQNHEIFTTQMFSHWLFRKKLFYLLSETCSKDHIALFF